MTYDIMLINGMWMLIIYYIGELSINNFTRLKEVLVTLKRIDLKNRVEEFEKKIASTRRVVLHSKPKRGM